MLKPEGPVNKTQGDKMLTHHALALFKRHTGLTNGSRDKLVRRWYKAPWTNNCSNANRGTDRQSQIFLFGRFSYLSTNPKGVHGGHATSFGILRTIPGMLAALPLSGCVSQLPPRILAAGQLPQGQPAGFLVAPTSDAQYAAQNNTDASTLTHCLIDLGMTRSGSARTTGTPPAYLVQIARATYPGRVMTLDAVYDKLPSALVSPYPPPASKPWPSSAIIEKLSLSISSLTSGKTMYRASIERQLPRTNSKHPVQPLAEVLCETNIRRSLRYTKAWIVPSS